MRLSVVDLLLVIAGVLAATDLVVRRGRSVAAWALLLAAWAALLATLGLLALRVPAA